MENKRIDKQKITQLLEKTWKDISFVNQKVIENAIIKAENSKEIAKNVDSEVDFMMRANQEIYYQISKEIKNDNLLLEIEMIDKLSYLPKITARILKLPYTQERKKLGEDALIKALESYDGTISFKKYAGIVIKKIYCPNQEIKEEKAKVLTPKEEVDIKQENKNQIEILEEQKETEKKLTIEDCIKEFSYIKEPTNKDNHELDKLFKDYKLDKNMNLEDPSYTKFVTLKFGYIAERFYSLEEISQILKIDQQEINNYYLTTLTDMKNYFNQTIESAKQYIKRRK